MKIRLDYNKERITLQLRAYYNVENMLLLYLSVVAISFVQCIECKIQNTCGRAINPPSSRDNRADDRIVGGILSKKGSWPWLAALATQKQEKLLNNSIKISPDFKCGGAVISNRLVLTAAHCCLEKIYLVRLGVVSLDETDESATDMLVKRMIVHPDFDESSGENDIALLLLRKKITFTDYIRPICLPREPLFVTYSYENLAPYVAGWGDEYEGAYSGSNRCREVRLPIYNLEECKKVYKKYTSFKVTDKNLCAGYKEGGKDSCQGDSGGPLMIRKGEFSPNFYIIGVVSFGWGCAQPGVPGVFTKVNSHMDWIDSILAKLDLAKKHRLHAVFKN